MLPLRKGRYVARLAAHAEDVDLALGLRDRVFRGGTGNLRSDADAFEAACEHVLVQEVTSGRVVCCCRLMLLSTGAEVERSYSAQFYDLTALSAFSGKMVEMGRFCIDPNDLGDPDILRVAWGAVTQFVDAAGVEMLFGCSSFSGVEALSYSDAFALLKERHLGPKRWMPGMKAEHIFAFSNGVGRLADEKAALLVMPPLLRTYLVMGGWVSDHAVVDHDLNTLHVFTGLEMSAIPATRARLLRAVASEL